MKQTEIAADLMDERIEQAIEVSLNRTRISMRFVSGFWTNFNVGRFAGEICCQRYVPKIGSKSMSCGHPNPEGRRKDRTRSPSGRAEVFCRCQSKVATSKVSSCAG